jgi:hypothetical protein
MNIIYYIHRHYIPRDFHRFNDEFRINYLISLIYPSVKTDEYLGGVWKQSIFKVLKQNHGIEKYHGIFSRGVWLVCKKLCFEYHGLLDTMIFLEYLKLHSNPKFS